MANAQVRDSDTVFFCRVAGVAIHDDRVLLHRSEHDDFWALPGGRIQIGETSAEALRREMMEEIGAEVAVGGLVCVVENFFSHYPLDAPPDLDERIRHHEIGLYLAMELPAALTGVDTFAGTELADTHDAFRLEFHWFDTSHVADLDVRPSAIVPLLTDGVLPTVPRIIAVD